MMGVLGPRVLTQALIDPPVQLTDSLRIGTSRTVDVVFEDLTVCGMT